MVEDNCFMGKWVKVDHPQTCLNPDEYFQVKEVRIDGCPMEPKIYIRGENTCWFNSKTIVDYDYVNPDNYNPVIKSI
jgi:hypothetical protein